jgi:hypothetical protein
MKLQKWPIAARWTARVLSVCYAAFMAFFIAAHALSQEGLPPLWRMPLPHQGNFLALLLAAFGGVLGWRWEGTAAVAVLFGSLLWLLINHNLIWPPGLSLLIGALYAFSWWSTKAPILIHRRQNRAIR